MFLAFCPVQHSCQGTSALLRLLVPHAVRTNGGSQHEHSLGSPTEKGVERILDRAAAVKLTTALAALYLVYIDSF